MYFVRYGIHENSLNNDDDALTSVIQISVGISEGLGVGGSVGPGVGAFVGGLVGGGVGSGTGGVVGNCVGCGVGPGVGSGVAPGAGAGVGTGTGARLLETTSSTNLDQNALSSSKRSRFAPSTSPLNPGALLSAAAIPKGAPSSSKATVIPFPFTMLLVALFNFS
jgi:hypothetical protein